MICTVDQRQLFRKNGWPAKADIVKALTDLDPDDFSPRAYCMDAPAEVTVFYDDYRRVSHTARIVYSACCVGRLGGGGHSV